jgi:heavy metal sensor kinase
MSIKKKVTVWYGILIAVLLLLSVTVAGIQIRKSAALSGQESLLSSAKKIAAEVTDAGSEKVKVPDGYEINPDITASVINTSNGKILADSSGMDWMSTGPYRFNSSWSYKDGPEEWLVYDYALVTDENHKITAIVRVCMKEDRRKFRNVLLALIAGSGLFLVIAVWGGFLILSKALRPLEDMTKTAEMIEKGDLSRRISVSARKDETASLGKALNSMLDRLENAIRKERQFSSDASHELKTPVAVMMNAGEQLLRHADPSDRELSEAARMVVQESGRMNRIITQLLILTRGDNGKQHPEIETIDLNELLKDVAEEQQERAENRKIRLELKTCAGLKIEADQTMITQVFMNLIENAIKYGREGGYVHISLTEAENEAEVRVEDNGIGISEEDLPHIFERFYRADRSRDRSGTGLGLSITEQIIRLHGGKIRAESRTGEGTVFTVTLNKKYAGGNGTAET